MLKIEESFGLQVPKLSPAGTLKVTEALLPAGGGAVLELTHTAISEGITRNYTLYSKEGLTHKVKNDQGQPGGLESWTQPYEAPVIKDHEASADNTIGRVKSAKWVEKTGPKDPGHVEITTHITNPEAIQKFLRGEYATGSIGMDVDKANCSVCGSDLKQEDWNGMFHPHQRGKYYSKAPKGHAAEGDWIESKQEEKGAKLAHVVIGNVWAREYSVVAVPSDMRSKVKTMKLKEMTLNTGDESINLMTSDFTEAEKTPATEVPAEKTRRSIAELTHEYAWRISEATESFYFFLASYCEVLTLELDKDIAAGKLINGLGAGIGNDMNLEEVKALMAYIKENNPDIEAELEELAKAVLTSEETEKLPDSAFALVKIIGDKKLRSLPYKNESGAVEQSKLITALTHWSNPLGFGAGEQARGLKKLINVVKRGGLGILSKESLETSVAEAKEFLAAQNFTIFTTSEVEEKLKAQAQTTTVTESEEYKTLEAANAEIKEKLQEAISLVAQRELEADEMVEKLSEANTAIKNQLVEQVIALEDEEDDIKINQRKLELLSKDQAFLEGVLTQLIKDTKTEREIVVTSRMHSQGLRLEEDGPKSDLGPIDKVTLYMARLGSPTAQKEIVTKLQQTGK